MEAAVNLDRPRITDGEPGFSLRDVEFRFNPSGASPDRYALIFSAETDSESLKAVDWFVCDCLSPEAAEAWLQLRDTAKPPLWFDELYAVARHIASVAAGRPTTPSNGSSPTPTANGTGSTADSHFTEVVPSPV